MARLPASSTKGAAPGAHHRLRDELVKYDPDTDDYDCRTAARVVCPAAESVETITRRQIAALRRRIDRGGDAFIIEHYRRVVSEMQESLGDAVKCFLKQRLPSRPRLKLAEHKRVASNGSDDSCASASTRCPSPSPSLSSMQSPMPSPSSGAETSRMKVVVPDWAKPDLQQVATVQKQAWMRPVTRPEGFARRISEGQSQSAARRLPAANGARALTTAAAVAVQGRRPSTSFSNAQGQRPLAPSAFASAPVKTATPTRLRLPPPVCSEPSHAAKHR
eukprot:TRINITY_DN17446_c0_g3_i1.p1 TRINITY_DN17446_c0_g3~~TRINITY_DN17446_c0_g3_i1.p1  ORF type:complete len:276 (+),score=40.45 TRINITY_DN17446_c0_g3_i1:32-859(+)